MTDEPTDYQRALGEGMAAWLLCEAAGQYAQQIMLSLKQNENSLDFPALGVAIEALLATKRMAIRDGRWYNSGPTKEASLCLS